MTKPVTPPERLILPVDSAEFYDAEEGMEGCGGFPHAEYVRADLYESANREIARLREKLENIRDKNYSTVVVARKYAREALSPATTTLWCDSDTDGEKPS